MALVMDPVTRGENGATMRRIEERFNRFENKNTYWRHDQNGTMAEFDRLFEAAVAKIRGQLGAKHPLVIDGKEIHTKESFKLMSPAGDFVIGEFATGGKEHVHQAIKAARKGYAKWRLTPWQKRAEALERAAEVYTTNFYELCAVMSLESGKTRFEASIDVDEAIDFLNFYAMSMREMNGFDMVMGKPFPNEACTSARKPFGVFAVLCPFNFPVAITTGMTAGAVVTGNAALMKPSTKGCLSGWWCFNLMREAGIPADVLHFLTGANHEVSTEMMHSPDIDGIVFTGSKRVGFMAMQKSLEHGRPKPIIAEMGGKNGVIVTKNANLDKAVEGVYKSAFGFSGQKCSACSRVYVDKAVAKEFIERLGKLTDKTPVGEPWLKPNFMGPVIEAGKIKLLNEVVAQVKKDGGRVISGGEAIAGMKGNYVRPTVVTGLPKDHRVFREEFFMPFVAVAEVDGLDEGIAEYNKAEYGLTAGIMSEDPAEIEHFFSHIESGVCYANRRAGGSTAAVVNGQSFVGWKNSGNTGNGAGGRYYLLQFTREQSHTRAT